MTAPRRRFFHFSLRAMLLLVLAIALALGWTQLFHLYLEGTQVTDAGVDKLQEALPNLFIHR